jgi:signal transduction histidine kinase
MLLGRLLGRLRIRGKLALLVAFPLLATVTLAVPVVLDRVGTANRAAATAAKVRLANRVGSLLQDLQQERLLSVGYLLGNVERTQLLRKSADVDDGVVDLRAEYGRDLPDRVGEALDTVRNLADVRGGVLARRATPDQVIGAFGPLDDRLIDSLRLPYDIDTTSRAGRQVLALDALMRADEGVSNSATLVILVVATKSKLASAAFISGMAALGVHNDRFHELATAEQVALADLEEQAVLVRTRQDFLTAGAVDPAAALAGVKLDTFFPTVASLITFGQFVEKKVAADVIADVTGQERRALTTAYAVSGLALLVIFLVVLLSVVVSRIVAQPLTRLTLSANRMARVAEAELTRIADDDTDNPGPVQLDPVDVRAADEVGDLARAFDRVQRTAASLVERQVASRRNVAQMFGHVGRRTQNLVGRQLSLIDRLEHQETDARRLQDLYRLDHVSSRLRRNASSLVVLSGADGSDGYTAPMPLADVVRLALGEIEDYTRVDVHVRPDLAVAPAVIGDLVLMLAELMENATAFSPPHQRVTVSGVPVPGGARVTLVDHGIGMTRERLAEENARLTRRERLDLAPTEVLGLFVVGRLARRHGWHIALSETPGGGITVDLEIDEKSLINVAADGPVTTIARVTVAPALPAALDEDEPTTVPRRRKWALDGPTPVRPVPQLFDPAALNRATRSLEAGKPWNAFAAQPAERVEPPAQPAARVEPPAQRDSPAAPPAAGALPGRAVASVPRPDQPASPVSRPGIPSRPVEIPPPPRSWAETTPPGDAQPPRPVPPTHSLRPPADALPPPASHLMNADPPATARPPGPPVGYAAAGPPVGYAGTGRHDAPRVGNGGPPAGGGRSPNGSGHPDRDAFDDDRPRSGSYSRLRQRVPGAQLPKSAPPRVEPDTVVTNPADVRAMMEQLEAGVRRAERDAAADPGTPVPAGSAPRPPAGAPPSAPAGAPPYSPAGGPPTPPAGAPPSAPAGAPQRQPVTARSRPSAGGPPPSGPVQSGPVPPLVRRVPGANLTDAGPGPYADRQPTRLQPDDPEEVRRSIAQLEAGIARAMHDISSEHRNEEGSPR